MNENEKFINILTNIEPQINLYLKYENSRIIRVY